MLVSQRVMLNTINSIFDILWLIREHSASKSSFYYLVENLLCKIYLKVLGILFEFIEFYLNDEFSVLHAIQNS